MLIFRHKQATTTPKVCVIPQSGFFADMEEILTMARAAVDSIETGAEDVEIGGPEVLSLDQIVELAFVALIKPARITHLPLWLCSAALSVIKCVWPRHAWGQFEFFRKRCPGPTL